MKAFKNILIPLSILCVAASGTPKELDCDETVGDRELLDRCCQQKKDSNSWTIEWPTDLKDAVSHKGGVTKVWDECAQVLKKDNLVNYYDLHYRLGRYVSSLFVISKFSL